MVWRRSSAGRLAVVGLLLLTAGLHAPGLDTGFLSDDFMILGHLHRAGAAHGWSHPFLDLSGVLFYRPLLTGSYALDRWMWGLDPWGYHLTNLLLHLAVTLLVYEVGRRLTGRPVAGLIAAGWIGLHAMNPNTVTWIAGRVSLLGAFFPLVALAAFLAHRARPGGAPGVTAGAAAVVATALGLLAKESALVVPPLLLLADLLLPGRRAPRAVHGALWGILAAYLVVRRLVLGVFLGGYGGPAIANAPPLDGQVAAALPRLGASVVDALADPGLHPGWLRWVALAMVGAALARWVARRVPHARAVAVALAWAGGMTVLLWPAWELAPANAERWYPALVGVALALGILLERSGRLGWGFAVVLVGLGLPLLGPRLQAYRDAGARVRAVQAGISAEPATGAPLFVYGLPLTLGPAPFLHHGLADALAPPFRVPRREVFVVHRPYLPGPADPADPDGRRRDLNPAAWLLAREGPVTVLLCDAEGVLRERVERPFLLDYDGFRATRQARSLEVAVEPARWRPGDPFRVRPGSLATLRDIRIQVFTAGGCVDLGPIDDPAQDLLPVVADYLRYPGAARAYVVVMARARTPPALCLGGAWVALGREPR